MTDDSMRTKPGLARRLLAWYTVTVIVLLVVLGFIINEQTSRLLLDELTDSLVEEAQTVRFALQGSPDIQADAVSLGDEIGSRITVIAVDGTVLADSERDPLTMENHAARPEVVAALAGGIGVDSRLSETVGISFRYVAIPEAGGVVYRMSVPLTDVEDSLGRLRFAIVGSGLFVVLVGVGAVWLIAQRISLPLVQMTRAIVSIADGDLDTRMPDPNLAESAQLARAVDQMADELGRRIVEADEASSLRDRVLSTLDESILLVGRSGVIAYTNQAARELFGDPGDVGGLTPRALRVAVEAALAGRVRYDVDFARGRPKTEFSANVIPIEGEMVVAVVRDITESKRVEAMRRDFVADASHELKTPVAAISAGTETILRAIEDGDQEAVARFAGQVDRTAARLARLVSDLLDLSRLESEPSEVELISIDRLVADEVRMATPEAKQRSIELVLHTDPVNVAANRRELALAVRNLLTNALRFTESDGLVRVDVGREGGWAVVVVKDTGLGIPIRDLPRIFERFYRVDSARARDTGGTGLGLAIIKHVVDRHGGSVDVESELGKGSKFTIRLPVADRPPVSS